jgi:hypothetical protein
MCDGADRIALAGRLETADSRVANPSFVQEPVTKSVRRDGRTGPDSDRALGYVKRRRAAVVALAQRPPSLRSPRLYRSPIADHRIGRSRALPSPTAALTVREGVEAWSRLVGS